MAVHKDIKPNDEVTIGGRTYRGEQIQLALDVTYSIAVSYAMADPKNGGHEHIEWEWLDEAAEKADKAMARRMQEVTNEARGYNGYTPPRKKTGGKHKQMLVFERSLDHRTREPKVATVAILRDTSGDRFIVIGTEYGHVHTAAGGIRTWGSYSGARKFAIKYERGIRNAI